MTTTLIAVDTGATHTRLAVGDAAAPYEDTVRSRRRIDSSSDLRDFVASAVDALPHDGPILLAGGFAGPREGQELRMTNWDADDRITADMFLEAGVTRARILNDLEAAASGLVHRSDSRIRDGLVPLTSWPLPDTGNRVLIIPGTGLGSAGILDMQREPNPKWRVVPGEAQHCIASAQGPSEAKLIAKATTLLGRGPTWDDLVSGRGLEMIHELESTPGSTLSAAEIAALAAEGDVCCLTSLQAYYAFAGSFAQTLALTFRAEGGVFIAGSSTRENLDVLRESAFASRIARSHAMRHLLADLPVFAVTAELNLLGAWSHAGALAD